MEIFWLNLLVNRGWGYGWFCPVYHRMVVVLLVAHTSLTLHICYILVSYTIVDQGFLTVQVDWVQSRCSLPCIIVVCLIVNLILIRVEGPAHFWFLVSLMSAHCGSLCEWPVCWWSSVSVALEKGVETHGGVCMLLFSFSLWVLIQVLVVWRWSGSVCNSLSFDVTLSMRVDLMSFNGDLTGLLRLLLAAQENLHRVKYIWNYGVFWFGFVKAFDLVRMCVAIQIVSTGMLLLCIYLWECLFGQEWAYILIHQTSRRGEVG